MAKRSLNLVLSKDAAGDLMSMARPPRTLRLTRFHLQGLSQFAWIGVAFAAFRLLQSPSTLTFFVFESALAATLGIFFAARAAPPNGLVQPNAQKTYGFEGEVDASSSTVRLQNLATRLGLASIGDVRKLYDQVRSEWTPPNAHSDKKRMDKMLALSLVDRIVSGTGLSKSSQVSSMANSNLVQLAKEGSNLLSLARDLGVRASFYRRALGKARGASGAGRVETAIADLERSNRRLRARLGAVVAHDLAGGGGTVRAYRILTSFFLLSGALALLVLSTALYVAPLAFYFLIAGAAGALSLNALLNGNRHWRGVLVQIALLATLVKFHFFWLNPYLYTSDSFVHFVLVEAIATTGHVPANVSHYSYFPGYHVFGFESVSVGGLPLTWFGLFAFVSQVVALPAVYLVGRDVASHRVGLLAAILALFSVFYFLQAIPLPSLFGLVFLFLAIHALVRIRSTRSRLWLAVFWISALGAFFSHPITALVLLLALLIRFVYLNISYRGKTEASGSAIPALSYGVMYAGYLSFIALVSFELFARTIFATTDVPTYALATTPVQALQSSDSYLLQSAVAPSGVALLFFFAVYGALSLAGVRPLEHRFIVVLSLVFVLVPALEFIAEDYRAQSSRFLSYMTIPLVLTGAQGAVSLAKAPPRIRRTAGILFSLFLTLAFVSASSYLTNNDARYLYSDIPTIPTHVAQSALASQEFLSLAEKGSLIYMDFGSLLYFGDNARARNALAGMDTRWLEEFTKDGQAFVLLNHDLLTYGNPYLGSLYDVSATQLQLQDVQASQLFDAGEVQVYLTERATPAIQ